MSAALVKIVKQLLAGKSTHPGPVATLLSELEGCLKYAAELQINGCYESALAESNRALQLDPTNVVAYHIRSLARHSLADEEGALADWKQSQRLRIPTTNET